MLLVVARQAVGEADVDESFGDAVRVVFPVEYEDVAAGFDDFGDAGDRYPRFAASGFSEQRVGAGRVEQWDGAVDVEDGRCDGFVVAGSDEPGDFDEVDS